MNMMMSFNLSKRTANERTNIFSPPFQSAPLLRGSFNNWIKVIVTALERQQL